LKIGEGKFYAKPHTIYLPKVIITVLELKDGDIVEFHLENETVEMVKKK